jgi:hypothetical protein
LGLLEIASLADMPISSDDQARLPPMTSYTDVAEKQRLADMKDFRKYLVDTGSAKSLVKLYQHIAQNEMRLDNPDILREFLSQHVEETEASKERDQVSEENASLRERNADLQAQVATLTIELQREQKLAVGKKIWQYLASPDFWQDQLGDEALAAGLPLKLLFQRLCGQKVDKGTGKVLVNVFQPLSLDEDAVATAMPMDLETFVPWIAGVIPDDLYEWCCSDLLRRFGAVPSPTEPPYERELIQAIHDTGFYPSNLDEVTNIVSLANLDPDLAKFFDAAADRFRS